MNRLAQIAQLGANSLRPAALSDPTHPSSKRRDRLGLCARPLGAVREPVVLLLLLTEVRSLQIVAPSQLGSGVVFVAADIDVRHRYERFSLRGRAAVFEGAESGV